MSWCLGVDVGTSFCSAAVATAAGADTLEIDGQRRIPSTVVLAESGELLAGTAAQRSAGRLPDRTERNPKRYVGRQAMLLGGTPLPAARALQALVAVFVKEALRRFDGTPPDVLVLTHPVAWTADQQAELRAAAEHALPGVPVRMLAEPVAAAWQFAATAAPAPGSRVAVYDLGGGTFDVAVVEARAGGLDVVGTPAGDQDIGGESFDAAIFARFGEQLATLAPDWWRRLGSGAERRWVSAAAELLDQARVAKEELSSYPTSDQYVRGADADVHISRAEFETMITADVERTVELLDRALADSDTAADGLAAVYLCGGAGRIPLVGQVLTARFGDRVRTWQDPKTVVALGAARYGTQVGGDTVPRPDPGQPLVEVPAWAPPRRRWPLIAAGGAVAAAVVVTGVVLAIPSPSSRGVDRTDALVTTTSSASSASSGSSSGSTSSVSSRPSSSRTTTARPTTTTPTTSSSSSSRYCGTVTAQSGDRVYVHVTSGSIACGQAVDVVDYYYNNPDLTRSGSSGRSTFNGWECTSTSSAEAASSGEYGRCAGGPVTIRMRASR